MKIQSLFTFSALSLFSASVYASGISEADIIEAQKKWGEGIVEIGKVKTDGGDYTEAAKELIDDLYAYDHGSVAFKPTLAADDQFRGDVDEALSYFVGGMIEEDKGFAIKPWTNVRFENEEVIINGNQAIAMGNYFFTTVEGEEVKVEYSFGYTHVDDELLINLHHSSLPYAK
ncbi:MAG: hypothetical protein CL550_04650 [Alcanivorax sp.]|jgi:hypothetical protein|uniref:hypothetical protein n=1 Tax=unclassified Alcanivorax TaxID=2638842 RepID=UPI000789CED0|nr:MULTISPECIES: hypothetical protein [unclassified Alcanivorax]MBB10222.1 hypothetical protein [Alcanivorax sp.]MBU84097.1 hypothetical protein [Alcanivorax sp.]MCK5919470.1 hypothetical protein [Methylococcales bacterium]|tara:strand:- start:643 stop:1161 length:519 start_codon:yes stop_codon:yes gene_type:complete